VKACFAETCRSLGSSR